MKLTRVRQKFGIELGSEWTKKPAIISTKEIHDFLWKEPYLIRICRGRPNVLWVAHCALLWRFVMREQTLLLAPTTPHDFHIKAVPCS